MQANKELTKHNFKTTQLFIQGHSQVLLCFPKASTSEMIYHHGASLSKQQLLIYYFVMAHSRICHCQLFKANLKVAKSSPFSPARAAKVATYAWTKLYTEIMN